METLNKPTLKHSDRARILCWLMYRLLEGQRLQIRELDLLGAIADHLKALDQVEAKVRYTWKQSLYTVMAYHAVLRGENAFRAAQLAEWSTRVYSAELNPGGIVNYMRCLFLIKAANYSPEGANKSISLAQIFRDSVKDWDFSEPMTADCMVKAAKVVMAESCLLRHEVERAIESLGPDQPFSLCVKEAFSLAKNVDAPPKG